jgi:hypothetical protein
VRHVRLVPNGMPANERQQIEHLPGVHRAAGQKVPAAAAICSLFKPMTFHQPRTFRIQGASACSLALNLARLLREVTHELFRCKRELTHVFVGMKSEGTVQNIRDVDCIINRSVVVHDRTAFLAPTGEAFAAWNSGRRPKRRSA